ncbi:hypothetical protein MCOR02_004540 [Pyricularia oryzae]|uniref:Uncharacterized protein n=1 Tax=Pyricularia oryzae TaxID=318829 RepID=A0A4P7MVQ6_PYROR|nr:hypothetical protein MCOR01_006237 [Pyricularia oryzae]KAH9435618.1 hypothetical protein MCOR02_004540 [Pyricularia oryzae]KAI6251723.1 hypothetical protein MCOR19_011643 [Pyricularia oryzae]KAI6264050.1 hypothetical protein MCOR26_011625 [Pyricularia oryzae]KAI6283443.1 hypothetical protein MCOR34_011040 [Pyricularia oryzae]
MQFNIKTILLTLGIVSAAMADCRTKGPGSEIGPSEKCPGANPFACAGTSNDIFGVCCSKSNCT